MATDSPSNPLRMVVRNRNIREVSGTHGDPSEAPSQAAPPALRREQSGANEPRPRTPTRGQPPALSKPKPQAPAAPESFEVGPSFLETAPDPGPATITAMLDSSVSSITSAESPVGVPENPRLRSDLIIEANQDSTVSVRAPESPSAFPIYAFEWKVAGLMNGQRSLSEIAVEMTRGGMAATPKQIRSFVRELRGYRFLEGDNAPLLFDAQPAETATPMSAEEKHLMEQATSLIAKGNLEGACNYLLAALEIDPQNHAARDELRVLQGAMTAERTVIRPVDTQPPQTPLPFAKTAPPPPRPRSERASFDPQVLVRPPLPIRWIAIGSAAAAAVSTVGLLLAMTSHSARASRQPTRVGPAVERAQPAGREPVQLEPVKPAAPPTVKSIEIMVALRPTAIAEIRAPVSGAIESIPVRPGGAVEAKATLATISGGGGNEHAVEKAKEAYEALQKKAEENPIYQDFAEAARGKYLAMKRRTRSTTVPATMRGVIRPFELKPGAHVRADQLLFEIVDASKLTTRLKSPFDGAPESNCQIAGAIDCQVAIVGNETPPVVQITVDNSKGELAPDQVVQVELTPALEAEPGKR